MLSTLAVPLDIIALCVDYVAGDLKTLLACSLCSKALRRLESVYLFQTVKHGGGCQTERCLTIACDKLTTSTTSDCITSFQTSMTNPIRHIDTTSAEDSAGSAHAASTRCTLELNG